jgi:hypothetical protein
MKLKFWTILIIGIAVISGLHAEEKRYGVKSGVIEYSITQTGNMMGMAMNGKGTGKTVFKEWGSVEVHTEKTESVTMGMKESDHIMTKILDGKVYVVDFDSRSIYEYTPDALAKSEYKDLVNTGKKMLESMGGKKVGDEKFKGYPCEVWSLMHVKVWLHKGVMLKSEADMMGIKHTMVATKIDLEASVSDDEFKLPDFPIKKASTIMTPQGSGMDGGMPQMTPEQMQQMQEMMKNFGAM